jgi:hypothetical protein
MQASQLLSADTLSERDPDWPTEACDGHRRARHRRARVSRTMETAVATRYASGCSSESVTSEIPQDRVP